MIGCPDCSLFGAVCTHRPDPDYPGPDPGGPDLVVPVDWLADTGGRDQ